jgi:hypothetical protein
MRMSSASPAVTLPWHTKPHKPLGAKGYGSIGHLPQSRVGPGDWHVHEGQARICLEKPRKGDRVIVSEKLDGSCMVVAKINGEIVPITRAGYHAKDGAYEHLRRFVPYVEERRDQFDILLDEGDRVAGEWLGMAIGTLYDRDHPGFSPFVPFDIFRGRDRVLTDEFRHRIERVLFPAAAIVHDGPDPCSIENALCRLGEFGHHGATEKIEGAVWRVEREGRVDFLAKYVRSDKVDGKYLPNISGTDPVWLVS